MSLSSPRAVAASLLPLVAAGPSMAEGKVGALAGAVAPEREAILEVWSFLPGNYEEGEAAWASPCAACLQVAASVTEVPHGACFDQAQSSVAVGAGPDIIAMHGASQAHTCKSGVLPLQGAADPKPLEQLPFAPSSESFSRGGSLCALLAGACGHALVTNNDAFEPAGLGVSEGLAAWLGLDARSLCVAQC